MMLRIVQLPISPDCRPAMNQRWRRVTHVYLGSLNQVTKGLAKTIRAMADGTALPWLDRSASSSRWARSDRNR
jgi:hypothetical protein